MLSHEVNELLKGGFPIGHISHRKDGDWKKVSDTGNKTKDWVKVEKKRTTKKNEKQKAKGEKTSENKPRSKPNSSEKKSKTVKTERAAKQQRAKNNKRLEDIGVKIGGAKKDLAAALKSKDMKQILDAIKSNDENEIEKYLKYFARSKMLEKIDYQEAKKKGMDGGVAYLLSMVYRSKAIPNQPKMILGKPVEYRWERYGTSGTGKKRNELGWKKSIELRIKAFSILNNLIAPKKMMKIKTLEEFQEYTHKFFKNEKNKKKIEILNQVFPDIDSLISGERNKWFRPPDRYASWSSISNARRTAKRHSRDLDTWSWYSDDNLGNKGKRSNKWKRAVSSKVIRKGPKIPEAKPEQLLSDFGFRGVEYGNWLTPEEQRHHVQCTYEALSDLADVLGIKPQKLAQATSKRSKDGLALAFGARGMGGASAHYEPNKRVINLTRMKGAGTLAHEFGHFLDHTIGINLTGEDKGGNSMLSGKGKEELSASDPIKQALSELSRAIESDKRKLKYDEVKKLLPLKNYQSWETSIKPTIKAKTDQEKDKRTVELLVEALLFGKGNPVTSASVEKLLQKHKVDKNHAYYKYAMSNITTLAKFGKQISSKTYNRMKDIHDKKPIETTSKYIKQLEGSSRKKYLLSPEEVFARCFEVYVSDKLEKQNRQNTYLVYGTNIENYGVKNSKDIDLEGFPYPAGEDRKRIVKAMDKFIKAIKRHKAIKKSMLNMGA